MHIMSNNSFISGRYRERVLLIIFLLILNLYKKFCVCKKYVYLILPLISKKVFTFVKIYGNITKKSTLSVILI